MEKILAAPFVRQNTELSAIFGRKNSIYDPRLLLVTKVRFKNMRGAKWDGLHALLRISFDMISKEPRGQKMGKIDFLLDIFGI